jgi:hypothetical protein
MFDIIFFFAGRLVVLGLCLLMVKSALASGSIAP